MTRQQLAQLMLQNPNMNDDELVTLAQQQGGEQENPIVGTAKRWWKAATKPVFGQDSYTGMAIPEAGYKALDIPANILQAMTSPLDLATLAASGGASALGRAGLMGAAKAARGAEAAGAGLYGAAGVAQAATTDDPYEQGAGALQAGLSALGVRGALKGMPKRVNAPVAAAASVGESGASVLDGRIQKLLEEQMAAHAGAGGSTFNPLKGNMAGQDFYSVGGVVPSEVVPQDQFSLESLKNFVLKNQESLKDPSRSVGTWANEGKVHLDITDLLPRADAERLMRERNEKAIFGLKNFDEVPNAEFKTARADGGGGMQANVLLGPAVAAGADPIASAVTDDPEKQELLRNALVVGGLGAGVGMAARGFSPQVLAGLKNRVLQQVQGRFTPQEQAAILPVLEKYKSAGLLGGVSRDPATATFADYALLPKQEVLEQGARNLFGRNINQLDEEEAWQLLQVARKQMPAGRAEGLRLNPFTGIKPTTVEHEMGHLGQDLARGGMIREGGVEAAARIPYAIKPYEVGARVREGTVAARATPEGVPGPRSTRERWQAELQRVNAATREQQGAGFLPDEMLAASEQLTRGPMPGGTGSGLAEAKAVGAARKQPTARELTKRGKSLKAGDWQIPSGPWTAEGIDLNERTLNKAKIVAVKRVKGGGQALDLQPTVKARFDKLLQYAEENNIGKDWANGNWMDSFASPQEALEFADHWAATSPRNQLSKNLTDAVHTFVSTRWGVPVEDIPNLLPAWKRNVKAAVKGGGAPKVRLSGPKVTEMQGGLRQDPDAVPIDVHFMRAAGYDPRGEMSGPFYDQFKTAFQQWSRERGTDPFPTMAKIWSAMRVLTGRTKGVPAGVGGQLQAAGLNQPSLFTKNPLLRFGPDTGATGAAQAAAREVDMSMVAQPERLAMQRGILPKTGPRTVSERFPAPERVNAPEGQRSLSEVIQKTPEAQQFERFVNPPRNAELARIRQLLTELGVKF